MCDLLKLPRAEQTRNNESLTRAEDQGKKRRDGTVITTRRSP